MKRIIGLVVAVLVVSTSSISLLAAPANGVAATVVSDDFSAGVLDEDLWTVVDPVGDGTVSVVGAGTTDVRLAMSLPAGVAHDPFGANRSLRVMQPVSNGDFEIAGRFVSAPALQYQMQGILVEQDAGNWLRFDVHSTGSGWRLYAAKTVAGKTTKLIQRTVPVAQEVTLKVARTGDVWNLSYSLDGSGAWAAGGSFTHALAPAAVGPFAGNSGSSPAFTAEVDWFFDTARPIEPEDGTVVETYPLTVDVVGAGRVDRSPSATAYPVGTDVTLDAVPATGWAFADWSGALTGTNPSGSVEVNGPTAVTARFTELPPQPQSAPTIDVWHGNDQTFGSTGTPQRWINVLGKVTDVDGVQSLTYRLNGGPPTALALGPDLRRLFHPGDFNVQLAHAALPAGPSTVVLRAVDGLGQASERSVTVRKSAGAAPLPRTVDWAAAAAPDDVAQVVDGRWRTGADGLTVVEMGYDRTVAIGDVGWTDYEVTVPVTVRGFGPGAGTPQSGVPLVGLGLHWNGHTPRRAESPAVNWFPTGAFAWFEWYGGGRFALQGNEGSPLQRSSMAWNLGTTYVMKARAETVAGGVRYSYKWWAEGAPEPSGWRISLVEDAGPPAGSVLLIAHHVDATFGTVTVNPL